jgi:hypothetical protein
VASHRPHCTKPERMQRKLGDAALGKEGAKRLSAPHRQVCGERVRQERKPQAETPPYRWLRAQSKSATRRRDAARFRRFLTKILANR